MKPFILLLFLVLSTSASFGQFLPIRKYLKEDGLPHTGVTSILQDSRGYIWFGTDGGLSRFDGVSFKNFGKEAGLPQGYILTIMEDSRRRTWIGTKNGGVSCFDSGRVTTYTTADGLANDSAWAIAEDRDGMMWFGTENGLSRFDGKNFKNFGTGDGLPSTIIPHIAIDRGGVLWFATMRGLCRFLPQNPGKPFERFSKNDDLLHKVILKIFFDSAGRTWIGTKNGLNCYFNGKLTAYTTKDGLINNRITALCEDRGGNLWIGTLEGVSVLTVSKTGGDPFINVTNYSTENGLPYNFIHSIMEDAEGNIWFATRGGAGCLTASNIATYPLEHGSENSTVKAVVRDGENRLWLGTGSGLYGFSYENPHGARFANKYHTERYTKKDGLISNSINGLTKTPSGEIWITTPEGLSIFSPETGDFKNYSEANGLPANILFATTVTRDGTIWITHSKGVTCFKAGKFVKPPFQLVHLLVSLLEDAKGNIWLSSDYGLYRYSPATGKLNRFTTADGLPGNVVDSIYEDAKGTLWIGTEDGLCSYNGKSFTTYSKEDGMPDAICNFFLEDKDGNLWIGTADGLIRRDGNSFKRYSSLKHGLTTDNWLSGYTGPGGVMWLGSAYGLTRLNPPIKINRVPPPVYISNVKVLDQEVPLLSLKKLEHNQNHLSIGFAGLCFSSPGSVAYSYRLEGIDKQWKKTAGRSLFYPYLPPGKYRFQVKALNNDGIQSLKAAQLDFTILPPYWKTWWFQTLIALALLSVIMLLVVWRFKRSKEKLVLKERTRQLVMSQRMELMGMLAGSAVHDLKNLLAIIIGFSEIIAETKEPEDDSYRYNENIKSTAGTAMQVVKQILAFARQQKDNDLEESDLTALMTDILEILKVTAPGEIEIRWNPPSDAVLYPMNPTRFQQLAMNLCINAVHAMPEGGVLEISISGDEEKAVSIMVSDTGTGIPAETVEKIFDPLFTTKEKDKGTGLGLFVVKQIVDENKGTIDVQSRPGEGTAFKIVFPGPR